MVRLSGHVDLSPHPLRLHEAALYLSTPREETHVVQLFLPLKCVRGCGPNPVVDQPLGSMKVTPHHPVARLLGVGVRKETRAVSMAVEIGLMRSKGGRFGVHRGTKSRVLAPRCNPSRLLL